MGFALGIFPILTVIGVWKLRKNNPDALRFKGFPITQIIYVMTGILILILSFLERPLESSVALLTVLVGVPFYFIFNKRGGNDVNN
jgi:APA family basic amino acid/polyamine antiporter